MAAEPGHDLPAGTGPDIEAWHRFCDHLRDLGDRLLEPRFPGSDIDRAEGVHHLATQVSGWLAWTAGHGDPEHPSFFRQNDTVMRWGGPNVDQTTRRARVEAAGTYRIRGQMNSCEDFILTQKDGDMHRRRFGILAETMASELGIVEGGEVDLVLSVDRPADLDGATWLPLHPDVVMVNVREYYWDWRALEPATITIERVDTLGSPPPRLAPGAVAAMLDEACEIVEQSLEYWNEYVDREQASGTPNVMAEPRSAAGGSSRIAYSFGFFDLADDEALVIECGPPRSTFWDVQLYSLGWFESLDFAHRTTSLNHTQTHVDTDGSVRFVVCATDPGVQNWLDTGGRRAGMITHRWIGGEPSSIRSTVVPVIDVRGHLPADTPAFSTSDRRAQITRRQRHVAWRYRT
jgi:hypothetical protein